MKEQVQLLKIVLDFLDQLSEEQLVLLIEKKARLKLETEKNPPKEPKTTEVDAAEVCKRLECCSTREEAMQYMAEVSLSKAGLKAVAKKYNISLGSKDRRDQIAEKIVENVVGSRLRFDALLNTDLKR